MVANQFPGTSSTEWGAERARRQGPGGGSLLAWRQRSARQRWTLAQRGACCVDVAQGIRLTGLAGTVAPLEWYLFLAPRCRNNSNRKTTTSRPGESIHAGCVRPGFRLICYKPLLPLIQTEHRWWLGCGEGCQKATYARCWTSLKSLHCFACENKICLQLNMPHRAALGLDAA